MGPPSRAPSVHPSPFFPLMTPSASPPVQRPFGRQAGTPSPTKKRRVSRAPSVSTPPVRGLSVTPSSSSSIPPAFNFDASVDPGEELHAARRASSFRVLNIWSQLEEKYTTPLDEDDIVDLRKETIVKDRGVLRSSGDMFEIGYFAEEREKAERLDNDLPLVPADDEPDELDAFADLPDNTSRSETDVEEEEAFALAQQTKLLPPVREIDPADAADLAEFLRAEKIRKETFGDPDEEEDTEGAGGEDESFEGDAQENASLEEQSNREGFDSEAITSDSDAHEETECEERESEDEVDEVLEEMTSNPNDGGRKNYSRLSTPSGSPEFDILDLTSDEKESDVEEIIPSRQETFSAAACDADSEDELAGWDHDEGSTLYSVCDVDEVSTAEEKIEILDEHEPLEDAFQSKPRKNRTRGKVRKPELSDTSPKDHRIDKSTSRGKAPLPQSPSPATIQLQTPPRSTSFGPEPSNLKATATYSRKKRGFSSSPRKKTPLRILSTESLSSESETEPSVSPETEKQTGASCSPSSPSKKVKLMPEVYIDAPHPSPVKKTLRRELPVEDNNLGSQPNRVEPAKHPVNAKFKGKAKALVIDEDGLDSENDIRTKPSSSSSRAAERLISSRPQATRNTVRAVPPEKLPLHGKKRERSPLREESLETTSTVDVIMTSPNRSTFRSGSRRASSSRKSVVNDTDLNDEGESSPTSRLSGSHSSRRPTEGQLHSNTSRPYLPPPALETFSFTPPQISPAGCQNYPSSHFASGYAHQQHASTLPNWQDPNAQYHLAQAIQSLSILMGGALPFPPSPVNPSHLPHHSPTMAHNGPQPWPPYTPRHRNRTMNFDTPQSTATAPPTSPLGSDYSDTVPSSPTKHPSRQRGRRRAKSYTSETARPKSAIRASRNRSRGVRRVSFSSPEATQIEDCVYEYVSDNAVGHESSDREDTYIERRRQCREEQSDRTLRLQSPHPHARAQTPGPSDHQHERRSNEEGPYPSASSHREPSRSRRSSSRTDRNAEAHNPTHRPGRR